MKKIAYPIFCLALTLSACKVNQKQKNSANFPTFSAEAHRGGRGLMPENTIIAMQNAMTFSGVTTLEMDTHISKDKQVVVTHDDYVSPSFMLTPEGLPIPAVDNKRYPIYQMDYSLIKTFDNGTKVNDGFPQQKKIKSYLPLLADLIDSVQAEITANNRKQVFYNIETKCSAKGDGITNPDPAEFVQLLMEVIQQKKITPFVVIQSFDKRTVQIIHKKYPNVKTAFLVDNKKTYEENILDLGYTPFILSPAYKMVNVDMINKAHAGGVKIIPWTVNTLQEISRLKSLGVDGIITDYPNLL